MFSQIETNPPQQAIEALRRQLMAQDAVGLDDTLSPWLKRSWQRCLDRGALPHQSVDFEPVAGAALRSAQEAALPLLQAAQPVVKTLARAMADTRFFALLTNAQGVVIDVHGVVDMQDPRARNIARVGVDLSEAAVGTTAIGAALAEQQPVWLHRGEHFFASNTAYSCAGAPVFGPQGSCEGMLDLTGIDVLERPALKHLVAQSARSIENRMVLATPHHLVLRINWPGQAMGSDSDGLLTLDADGLVQSANRVACDMLSIRPLWQHLHISELVAGDCNALYDQSHQRNRVSEWPLWSGLRIQVMSLDDALNTPNQSQATHSALPLKDVETSLIRKAVDDANGNMAQAAKRLGISRATIYRKLGGHKP